MALQTGIHKFTGRLDNIIGYRRNGKYFLRSMPDQVRQTAATKRAARRFGIASRKGKLVRRAILPHLDVPADGTLVNRLNSLFIQSGRNGFPDLQGFRFNRHAGMEKLFTIPPVFTVNGTLHIPAQKLELQGSNTHLELRLIAVRIDFRTQRILSTASSSAIIEGDNDGKCKGLSLSVPVEGEGALIVSLQCRACKSVNGILFPSGDRRCIAADIIHLAVPMDQLQIPDALILKATRKRFVFRKQGALPAIREARSFVSAAGKPAKGPSRSAITPEPGTNPSPSPPSFRTAAEPPPSARRSHLTMD